MFLSYKGRMLLTFFVFISSFSSFIYGSEFFNSIDNTRFDDFNDFYNYSVNYFQPDDIIINSEQEELSFSYSLILKNNSFVNLKYDVPILVKVNVSYMNKTIERSFNFSVNVENEFLFNKEEKINESLQSKSFGDSGSDSFAGNYGDSHKLDKEDGSDLEHEENLYENGSFYSKHISLLESLNWNQKKDEEVKDSNIVYYWIPVFFVLLILFCFILTIFVREKNDKYNHEDKLEIYAGNKRCKLELYK